MQVMVLLLWTSQKHQNRGYNNENINSHQKKSFPTCKLWYAVTLINNLVFTLTLSAEQALIRQ